MQFRIVQRHLADGIVRICRKNGGICFLCFILIACLSITTTNASHIRREDGLVINHRVLKSSKSKTSFNYSLADWHDDSKGKAGDEFGEAVAIQNNVAIVGSPDQSDFPLYEVSDGKVFIFIDPASTNEWEIIREVTGEDATEFFGACLALHYSNGNYFAVVGAPRGNRYGQYSGGAYYFNVQTDASKDQDYPLHLVQKERHGGAHFGSSVAISEVNGQVRVAIGAYGHRQKGAVFMYTRAKDGTLTDELILYGSVSKSGGEFGYSVAFNDNLVAVGAPVLRHGTVFVFALTASGTFDQVSYVSAPATASGDNTDDTDNSVYYYFGGSLAVGNGFLFVGSPLSNLRGQNSGSVYIYDITDSYTPNFIQTLFPSVHDSIGLEYGWSMSYDVVYKKLLVGSCFKDSGSYLGGEAYVYTQKGEGYFLEAALHANKYLTGRTKSESSMSLFGKGVDIYGDSVIVGAPFGNGEQYRSGDVYFFKAQTKEAFFSSESTGANSSLGMFDLSSTTVQLSVLAAVFILAILVLYRRYRTHSDDEEGFGTFLATGCVTDEGDEMNDDDSAHSNHPMIVRSSKEGKKGSKSGKKGGKVSKKGSGSSRKGGEVAYKSVQHDDL